MGRFSGAVACMVAVTLMIVPAAAQRVQGLRNNPGEETGDDVLVATDGSTVGEASEETGDSTAWNASEETDGSTAWNASEATDGSTGGNVSEAGDTAVCSADEEADIIAVDGTVYDFGNTAQTGSPAVEKYDFGNTAQTGGPAVEKSGTAAGAEIAGPSRSDTSDASQTGSGASEMADPGFNDSMSEKAEEDAGAALTPDMAGAGTTDTAVPASKGIQVEASESFNTGESVSEAASTDGTAAETAATDRTAADTASTDRTAAETASTDETAAETASTDETAAETASMDRTAAETAATGETAAETASTDETAAETASTGETAAEAASTDGTAAETAATDSEAPADGSAVSNADDQTVRVHLAGRPGDPVPAEVMDTDTASLLKLVSEGLVILDENGDPLPGCAEEWEVSDDGLKWVFRLRKDLRWSDGEPMDAEDFVKMFRKIADPATEALYGHDLMKNIAGYEDVLRGDPEALQVRAKNDRTFVVDLSTPDPAFARTCAAWTLLPVREQIGEDSPKLSWKNITGNGPYVIDSENLNDTQNENVQGYILKKNTYYKNKQVPFEEVQWIVEGDVNKEYSDLLNDNFDAVSVIPQEGIDAGEKVSGEEKESVITGTDPGTSAVLNTRTLSDTIGILFNCGQEALRDYRVRSALSMALDREYIARELLSGVYEPVSHQEYLDTLIGADSGAGQDEDDQPADSRPSRDEDDQPADSRDSFEEARELLKEAGYENGEGFPALTCLADENGSALQIAEYIAAEWKKLGIELRVEKSGEEDLAQEKEKGLFDIVCGNILLSSDPPAGEFEKFTTDHRDNTAAYSSEKYDSLLEEAANISGEKEYLEKLEEAAQILKDETPTAPLAAKNISWLRQDELKGVFCDATGCWQLWNTQSADVLNGTEDAVGESVVSAQEDRAGTQVGDEEQSAEAPGVQSAEAVEEQSAEAPGVSVDSKLRERSGPGGLVEILLKALLPSGAAKFAPEKGSFMDRMFNSAAYYQKTDQDAWLIRQAYVLDVPSEDAQRLISLPKYTRIHLTGVGNTGYVRISADGKFRYLEAGKVTTDVNVLNGVRTAEESQALQMAVHSESMHPVRESELKNRAAGIREDMEQILAEIAFREALRTQTRSPEWDGPVLSRSKGSVYGPNGKETYYNLNMNGVVGIMRRMGNTDEYWVRDDGCKMLGNYIMCAANLSVHPRGSLVECSLGTCIVCDTGGFASRNAHQLDIAVTW